MWAKKPSGGSAPNQIYLDKISEINGAFAYNGTVVGGSGGGAVISDSSGFFYQRENLHDLTAEVSGSISTADGSVVAHATNKATAFIPVESGVTYISNFTKTVATYNAAKTFLGMLSTTAQDTADFIFPRPFNVPAGVSFVRYTRGSHITAAMFVRGSTLPHEQLAPGIKQLWVSRNSYVDSLRLQTNPLYGLKWNALGDSVTLAIYADPDTVNVVGYAAKISSQYGVTLRNYGIGGTRITATGDGKGFCQRFGEMSNDADIVTVFGGINDYAYAGVTPIGTFGSSDTATIHGAMKVLCEGLLQKYPTQKLGFIIPFPFNEYRGAGTWEPYYEALVHNLEYYSIPFLDLYKKSRLNANISFINTAYFKDADKTHPNSKGHAILASKIYSFLLTL